MGVNYLWDSNTVIYFLQKMFPPGGERFMDEILKQSFPVISAITEIELLCWKTATENDLAVLRSFISDTYVIELEQGIKDKTSEVRRARKMKLPDAIIAATAIVYNLTLLSRNTADFKDIPGLKLENPWEQ